MTGMLREVLRLGCAATVVFTAAQAAAMQPAPGAAPPAGVSPPGPPPPPPEWSRSLAPYPWQPGSAPALEQPRPKRVWYGWQHLIVLGGTLGLVPLAVATENEPLAWLAAGAFVLGGPVTHWANGHLGKGFASLGLNAGGTLGGGMVGLLIGSSSDSSRGWDEIAGMLIGSSLGLLTANIIDIAVLQHEEPTTTESYDYIRLRSPRLRLAPHVGLAPDRATFGLGGAF